MRIGANISRLTAAGLLIIGMAAMVRAEEASGPIGKAWEDPRNPIVRIFGGQRLELWSLRPITRPQAAIVQSPTSGHPRSGSIQSPIDAFIVSRLQEKGLDLQPAADKRTLVRRLYFDLTGLPPTPEDIVRFMADERPDAYERLVDELLASPAHGEHAARMWLDAVRYSDSNGFDWDEFRPQAWRYRDYVIRSLNADKPFDQFIREQLAGDELLAGPPQNATEQDALVATGFLRMGPQDNAAGLFDEQSRARHELLVDLTETTGSAFLGLTLSCCRCHDHKHDPLSQADHYRLRAFFEAVKFAEDVPLDLAAEQAAINAHNASLDPQIEEQKKLKEALLAPVKQRLRDERIAALSADEKPLLALPEDKRPAEKKEQIEKLNKQVEPSDEDVKKALSEGQKQLAEAYDKYIAELNGHKRPLTHGLLMTDDPSKVAATYVLYQGDHKAPREVVEPGFLTALNPSPATVERPAAKTTGRRLTLAAWIASPENPLTARVIVNRLWFSHFGRGIVATPNDFGLAGARPTHPELLDWLSTELVRRRWSLKEIRRQIVTSSTYRQGAPSTEIAAELYAGMSLRRLSAEQLRDALLQTSGLMTQKAGGKPVWPELPPEILQANPAFLDDNAQKTKGWYPSMPHEQHVRSVYLVQKRTVRVPFMETFDLPENMISCGRRETSTVAPQALSLLNSQLAAAAAQAFAERVTREAGDQPTAQVDRSFLIAFSRQPDDQERASCMEFLRERTLAELCRAILNTNEFLYVD